MDEQQSEQIVISKQELLNLFANNDYPIIYQDQSVGRGMGYADFERLVNHLSTTKGKR